MSKIYIVRKIFENFQPVFSSRGKKEKKSLLIFFNYYFLTD